VGPRAVGSRDLVARATEAVAGGDSAPPSSRSDPRSGGSR